MNAEALALLARAIGASAAAAVVVSAAATWLRERSAPRTAWTVGAGLALGCAIWVHTSVPRTDRDALIAVGAAWLVPALVLAAGHLERRTRMLALGIGCGGSVVAILYQPFWDVSCVGACGPADAVVTVDPRFAEFGGLVLAVAAAGLAGVVVRRVKLALAAAIAGIGWAAQPWLPAPAFVQDLLAVGLAVIGLASAILVWPRSLQVARARVALRELTAPVPTPSGRERVNELLQAALGDPTVRLRLPGDDLPADKTTVAAVTELVRASGQFATLESERPLDPVRAAAALTPAVLMGIDDEVLRHGIAARIEDLNESHRALLETSDRERRRLERDAHDGAQQYLLAALAQLAVADPPEPTAMRQIRDVLGRLQSLTRGISSPILDSASLEEELVALAERADTHLVISGHLDLAGRAARNVYAVLAAAAAVADRLGQPELVAEVSASAGKVMLRLEPGKILADPLTDYVQSLGGTARFSDSDTWVVTLSCE